MTDWGDGYVADIAYTPGFYRELSPVWLHHAAELVHTAAPSPDAPLAYCDLGCGQGFGTLVLAAQFPDSAFHGIDFNPGQIANARDLAQQGGVANAHFHELSFQQAADADAGALPVFDVVGIHGIYSWISAANREAIVRFLDRWLKPGGLVYISYNCMPGWAAMAPLQRLLAEHAERHPDRSDAQIKGAMAHVQALRGDNLGFFTANPLAGKRLDALADKDRRYLAHEFLNAHWHPLYHTDVRAELAAAKLEYAGSASLLENFDTLALPEAARRHKAAAPDNAMAELVKDYALNQQFRRDLFVKGRRALTAVEESEGVRERRFTLIKRREDVTFTFQTPQGEATGDEALYKAVCDALSAGVTRVQDILERTGLDLARANQALAVLCASGQAHSLRAAVSDDARAAAKRFNAAVAHRAMLGDAYAYLAAPAIGTALSTGTVEMACYDVLAAQDVRDAETLGAAVWQRLRQRGTRLKRDGEVLRTERDNQREAVAQAGQVLEAKVPLWRHLGVL
ncbi:Methyltransferase domain-containing protein [Limimonas halophila]|uniref:Methyltransferase domain-containing protein n=1 Tax=Limimonas halophila TaxID=1082479 RepID=A0A1G7S0E1_9PROT|nr:class I SAM-dependent methyltransferase [Limimonas halophila]SDG16404.1 Methyltransferase domain-containing protein [Limimonas halophila]